MDTSTLVLLIPIVGIVCGLILWVVTAWLIVRHKSERETRQLQAALALVEKGLPVPPELLHRPNERFADLRRGVVLLMLGIALGIGLNDTGAPWTFALIPGLMGIGFLIVWVIESRAKPE